MTSTVEYLGDLRTICVHLASDNQIITDAPVDNHGKGEAFSPTDLTATSLATCMITIMSIAADTRGWNIAGAKAQVLKTMASNPRRISKIEITVHMPKLPIEESDRDLLEKAAKECPVAKSIHPDIEQVIIFIW